VTGRRRVGYRWSVPIRIRSLSPPLTILPLLVCTALVGAIAVSTGAAAPTSAARAAGSARCPISAGSPTGGNVQWAFTDSAPPSGAHPGIASSYTHGHGTWTGGHASGTVCHEDTLTGGHGSRELVLRIGGTAKLSPGITRLGLRGVALELKGTVSASNDPACVSGTHGTVTLFASYYSVHRDSVQLRFTGGCADHDHTFIGSQLRVLLTRGGAQVN
jgi:hypothetical protein